MINIIFLFNYLLSQGLSHHEADQMVCLAYKESSFKIDVTHKNRNKTIDYGLFQINSVHFDTCDTTPKELLTFEGNVSCAVQLYKTQGPKIWATYRSCKWPNKSNIDQS